MMTGSGVMSHEEKIEKLSEELEASGRILTALGDENRQYLILEMMKMGDCSGVRAMIRISLSVLR